jgi:hypothetical protein
MNMKTCGGFILISLLAILLLVGSAGAMTTQNIGYVNYDDSGFTNTMANMFSDAIVRGPAPTILATTSVTYNGMNFTPLKRADISTENLSKFDTIILFQICDINTSLSPAQHTAINNYLATGHKILLFDADRCAVTSGGKADYSWFTFPFNTSSPGPNGATGGTIEVVENSTLTNGLASDPWGHDELGGFIGDELGDANTATTSDPNWCAAAKTINGLGNNGFWLSYARNTGLIIYNGADNWFTDGASKSLTDTFLNMLNQSFNPDGLPCSIAESLNGSISGMKFNDSDGNGVRDNGEVGLVSWTITLTNEAGNTITNTTDVNGNYSFTDLPAGNYTVGEVSNASWKQTAPKPIPPGTYFINLTAGENVRGKDFGNQIVSGPISPPLASDSIPPVINSVELNTTIPNTDDAILITVNATDNVGVTSIIANGASLTVQGGNTITWSGTITAIEGIHSVNVSARDAADNVAWNNSTSYTAISGPIPPVPELSTVILILTGIFGILLVSRKYQRT